MKMKQNFARPTPSDLRFVRNSKFRQEDFDESARIADTMVDGALIIAFLFGLLAVIWLLS
jgi:hypothetical protein